MPNAADPDQIRLLRLHRDDNVAVLPCSAAAGTKAACGDIVLELPRALEMGHKIAIAAIPAGADIVKYGAPIGIATTDIAVGAHVHLHNIKSRYTVIEDMEAIEP
ncbi:MAG: SAF domain-containing protein [Pseudomonadota bacterium]